jgi:hypothetical protein
MPEHNTGPCLETVRSASILMQSGWEAMVHADFRIARTVTTTVSFPRDVHDELSDLARTLNIPKTNVLQLLVRIYGKTLTTHLGHGDRREDSA